MQNCDLLKTVREQLGWTQRQLAEHLEINSSYLSQLEGGKRPISEWMMKRIRSLSAEQLASQHGNSFVKVSQVTPGSLPAIAEAGLARLLKGVDSVTANLDRELQSSVRAMMSRAANVKVTAQDFRRGFVSVPLTYRVGEAPTGYPSKLRVAAFNSVAAARLLPKLASSEDAIEVMLRSLPEENRKDAFLDLLTPGTIWSLVFAAVLINYGLTEGRELLSSLGYKLDERV